MKHRSDRLAGVPSGPRATANFPLSDTFQQQMHRYVSILDRWRRITNLISDASFEDIWTRHIQDCAQIAHYAPGAVNWVDMGSGAGLPGLVIAAQLAGKVGAVVHCIESDQRKCAFLREIVRELQLPAIIYPIRIEDVDIHRLGSVQAVTARALAPLPRLLSYATPFLDRGAVGLFPRGRSDNTDKILEPADYHTESFPSAIDPDGHILRIRRNL